MIGMPIENIWTKVKKRRYMITKRDGLELGYDSQGATHDKKR